MILPSVSDFYNLALFICHLFIDGQFRNGHILYDPTVFDSRFITDMESICPHQIPWRTTNIYQPSSFPWDPNQRSDHILQLIFFEPRFVSFNIDQFRVYFSYYRIFAFSSTNGIETRKLAAILKNINPFLIHSSSNLVVHYNTQNGEIDVDWIPNISRIGGDGDDQLNVDPKAIAVRSSVNDVVHENLFSLTFGLNERMQITKITADGTIFRNSFHINMDFRTCYFMNYYYLALKSPCIRWSFTNVSNNVLSSDKVVRYSFPNHSKFYKELLTKYNLEGHDLSLVLLHEFPKLS